MEIAISLVALNHAASPKVVVAVTATYIATWSVWEPSKEVSWTKSPTTTLARHTLQN